MILMVDFVSKRYGMLPSELLVKGNSFDVFVAETAVGYENYLHKKDSGQGTLPVADLTQEQMQAMIDRVKNRENKGSGQGS